MEDKLKALKKDEELQEQLAQMDQMKQALHQMQLEKQQLIA